MFRMCVLGVLVPALAVAAPVPKVKANKLYFPVRVGDKKVMKVTVGEQTSECTRTVTKVSVTDGVYTVTIEQQEASDPLRPTEIEYEVSEKGVAMVTEGDDDLPARRPEVKLPAVEGDTWVIARGKAGRKTWTYTTVKEEEVEVPGGKFTAVVVECLIESRAGCGVQTSKSWYASGVGLVKYEWSYNDAGPYTMVLKSFTPGKEEMAEPKTGGGK